MKRYRILPLVLAFLTGGCSWFLPAGDPPDGNILVNTTGSFNEAQKASEVSDYFISALTVALLENCPGVPVALQPDDPSRVIAYKIFRETSRITGNSYSKEKAEWLLKSGVAENKLQLTLFHRGRQVWQEKLAFSFNEDLLR
ncbi:MAG: hypothetical protein IKC82_05665 [Lentisphaeria bacterium]|nr:hypothetical protein [Lentisphaeria bacterium]